MFFLFIFFATIAILPSGLYLLVKLEGKYKNISSLPKKVDGILILGGPSSASITKKYNQVSFNSHGERLTESIKLIKKYQSAKIIFSGGSGHKNKNFDRSHAYVAKKFYNEMGFKDNIIYEFESRNTYENIIFSKKIANPKNNEVWLLVTSAFHMPRAINTAKKQKWNMIPYPVDYQTLGDSTKYKISILHILNYINTFNFASHEWVGLISYYILNRTEKIF